MARRLPVVMVCLVVVVTVLGAEPVAGLNAAPPVYSEPELLDHEARYIQASAGAADVPTLAARTTSGAQGGVLFLQQAEGRLTPPALAATLAGEASSADPGGGASTGEAAAAVDGKPSGITLTLSEAIDMALENNSLIKQAELARTRAGIEADQAYEAARRLEKVSSLSQAQVKYLADMQKKLALEIADRSFEVTREQVRLLISKDYYALVKARALVEANQRAVDRAAQQLAQARAASTAGTVSRTDVLAAEAGLARARADLAAAENQVRTAEVELARQIGSPLNVAIKPQGAVERLEFGAAVDLDAAIAEAQEKRLDIRQAVASVEVAREAHRLAVAYTAPNTYTSRLAEVDLQQAELALEDKKKQAASEITTAYLSVRAAEEVLDYLKAGLEQARENHRLASLRYEVGVGTSLEVLQASEQLLRIESQYVEALFNYNLAVLTFETAKVAPISAVTGGATSSASGSSTSGR